jgi:membrane protease YdiL (CAAX protease family)
VSALALARLLVRFRWRSLWNGAWRVPRQRALRIAWFLVLLAPVAYVGLFANAFAVIVESAPLPQQAAVLALVAGVIVLASATGKMATSEAVIGGSGENEFLLTRPVALETLVTARSFAGVATNLFDALFLFPVLVAAALVWELGLPGVLLAALVSAIVQVGVSAVAQAGQILVVRLVPPARRRLVWSVLALVAALGMAILWAVGTSVLRRPIDVAGTVGSWTPMLRLSPGGWVVEPFYALARGWPLGAVLALAAPLELTLLAVLLAGAAVRWAGRAGWEQAGTPWAEAARGPAPGARMTLFMKDWHLVIRDRSRLVTLVAVPVIFVGLNVFGGIGWSWTTGNPRHVAMLAYSLAAYMAGLGPLVHMEAERRSFWLLRVAPVSLGRILAWKAAFWSAVVGSVAALVAFGLLLAGDLPVTGQALGVAAFAVLGTVTASCLAVAMGSATADFSDDTRRAVGPGTLYLFLLVAGLFNVALLEGGAVRARILLLYALAVALHWLAGVRGAARVFDPESRRERQVVAADGATLAVLLFMSGRVPKIVGDAAGSWSAIAAGLLAVAAGIYVARRRRAEAGWSLPAAIGAGAVAGVVAAPWHGAVIAVPALLRAAAEELVFRGIVQRGLVGRGRWVAFAVAAAMALVAGGRPLGWAAVVAAVVPGVALAVTGRLAAAGVARLAIELLI